MKDGITPWLKRGTQLSDFFGEDIIASSWATQKNGGTTCSGSAGLWKASNSYLNQLIVGGSFQSKSENKCHFFFSFSLWLHLLNFPSMSSPRSPGFLNMQIHIHTTQRVKSFYQTLGFKVNREDSSHHKSCPFYKVESSLRCLPWIMKHHLFPSFQC